MYLNFLARASEMNAEIRASITVPSQCIPAAVHPTIDNDAWSYWGGFWNSHMGSFPQGWGIIAALRWYGEGKHRFAVVFAWCVVTFQSCWFNKGRGAFGTRAVILWCSVWFVLTNRRGKKKRTGERQKCLGLLEGSPGRTLVQYETLCGQTLSNFYNTTI